MENEFKQKNHGLIGLIVGVVLGVILGYSVGIKGFLVKDIFDSIENELKEDVIEIDDIALDNEISSSKNSSHPQLGRTITDRPNAVTMVSYSHTWMEEDAQISVKNTIEDDIVSITGRMIYYDMSGNMLDYQDFTQTIDIEKGMTKRFSLPGYNHEENFVYYKNDAFYLTPNNKYKVKFVLHSYQIK